MVDPEKGVLGSIRKLAEQKNKKQAHEQLFPMVPALTPLRDGLWQDVWAK